MLKILCINLFLNMQCCVKTWCIYSVFFVLQFGRLKLARGAIYLYYISVDCTWSLSVGAVPVFPRREHVLHLVQAAFDATQHLAVVLARVQRRLLRSCKNPIVIFDVGTASHRRFVETTFDGSRGWQWTVGRHWSRKKISWFKIMWPHLLFNLKNAFCAKKLKKQEKARNSTQILAKHSFF